MNSIFYATYDSRNFSFEAVAETEVKAVATLIKGLQRHTEEYNLEPDWWEEEGIEVREIALNTPYRDKDKIRF